MEPALVPIALGLVIGAVLGGLGGGGAILTVPALVFVVGQSAQQATTSSLIIVGLSAGVGALSYLPAGRVQWRTGLTFAVVGLPATWLGGRLNAHLDADLVLLGFAALMLVAAAAMVADQRRPPPNPSTPDPSTPGPSTPGSSTHGPSTPGSSASGTVGARRPTARIAPALAAGLGVGLLTGLFGVGGGFVIVPALVLLLQVPMPQVVGTSLVIVALNSATSLATRIGSIEIDWAVVAPFTLAAMAASMAGKRVADRLPARQLKLAFAALMVAVALYTGTQSVLAP